MSIITLKNEKQFKLVKKYGEKASYGSLILVYFPKFYSKADLPNTNFYYGMKVSKKFSKSSPQRNRAKRRIRALIHDISKDFDICAGGALMIIPKKNFNNYPFDRTLSNLKKQMREFVTNSK